MNEFEENKYNEIKNELIQSVIDKKVDNYFVNRNELTHYYNVGKMIIDAQGGEERSKYGDGLIKRFSKRLEKENNIKYSVTSLKYMRMFYIFLKSQPLADQFKNKVSWSHYQELLSLKDTNEINYYIDQTIKNNWSNRKLREHIKNIKENLYKEEVVVRLSPDSIFKNIFRRVCGNMIKYWKNKVVYLLVN